MRKYSKAYYLKDLRQFEGWKELDREDSDELQDDTIVFVQDNHTVVKDCFEEEDYIFNDVTPEWIEFLEKKLDPPFEIPEDLRYAYEEEEGEEAQAEAEAPPPAEESKADEAGAG